MCVIDAPRSCHVCSVLFVSDREGRRDGILEVFETVAGKER